MVTRAFAVGLVAGILACIVAAAAAATAQPAPSDPGQALRDSIKKANLIVVAKITRKAATELIRVAKIDEEATKAKIDSTLMGPDLSGQEITVMTNPALIEKDKTYVLFYNRPAGGSGAPVGMQRMDATKEAIEAVKKEISAQGGRVTAKRAVWMVQHSGLTSRQNARVREFIATADGDFEWAVRTRDNQATLESAAGKMPKEALAALTAKLSAAGTGPAAEDAGYVTLEFLDKEGKLSRREYSMPGAAPCAGLLSAIGDIVKQYGGKLAASKVPSSAPAPGKR